MTVTDIAAVTVGFDDEHVLLTIDAVTDEGPHTFVMAVTPYAALNYSVELAVACAHVTWPEQAAETCEEDS